MIKDVQNRAMLVTARLLRNGFLLGDGIRYKTSNCTYTVSTEHRDMVGSTLAVVAGPHKDYNDAQVFTVELLDPPKDADLPFFNKDGGWEYVTINIE
jgi:hypothetical protein